MDEKDRQIERLFDDYASSLEPNMRLADRAKSKMRSRQRPKRSAAFWGGLVAACAVLLAIVFSAVSFFGIDDTTVGGNKTDNSAAAPSIQSYTTSDVRALAVDENFANSYINTQLDSAQIYRKKYYACYLKQTDEFVYLKAVFSIECDGGSVRMGIIVENADYLNKQRANEYNHLIGSGYRYANEYVKGEYITKAYMAKAEYRYYVTAMGNAQGAHEIAEEIIDK